MSKQAGRVDGSRQEAAVVTGFAVCGLLLFGAWLIDNAYRHEATASVQALREGERLADERLADALTRLSRLPVDLAPGETAHAIAILEFERARKGWPLHRGEIEALRESYVEALRRAPARPFAWARLAYLEQALGHAPERVIDVLRMSIYIGPAEPWLALWRLRLAVLLRAHWDDDLTALLPRQIAAAWRGERLTLVDFVLDNDLVDLAREGLRLQPEQLGRFDALVERAITRRERSRG